MDSRKRLFIAFSITMIIIVSLLTSFGQNLLNYSTPSVSLPSLDAYSLDPDGQNSALQTIEVTPRTVQSVIASLQPSQQYHRNLLITLFWGEEDYAQTSVDVWTYQDITRIVKTMPSGQVREDIITPEIIYYWHHSEDTYTTTFPSEYAQDVSQSIPSYQTVLSLDVSSIQQANYDFRHLIPCIFIEATQAPLYFTERYWVHAETGLLLEAETYDQGRLIYRMEGMSEIKAFENPQFILPDGTVLLG